MPNKACGLIGGTKDGGEKHIKKVYLLTNIDESNEHFSMDPKEQLAAVKDMRANGYQLLGNFHSHPESPSRPSEEDKRLAYDSKVNYLILSLMDLENPVLNAFVIDRGEKCIQRRIDHFLKREGRGLLQAAFFLSVTLKKRTEFIRMICISINHKNSITETRERFALSDRGKRTVFSDGRGAEDRRLCSFDDM